MQSILFIGHDKDLLLQKANMYAGEQTIGPFDITTITKETVSSTSKSTSSIGISIVREMQQKVFLKPLKGKEKAVILHDAELLTIEAQNALLKLLEEPPESTTIIVTSTSADALLPTILSRCKIILLKTPELPDAASEYIQLFTQLPTMSVGERLKLAEKVGKGKDETITWLEQIILAGREHILEMSNPKRKDILRLKTLQETYKIAKTTNTNIRLTLEHLFLTT